MGRAVASGPQVEGVIQAELHERATPLPTANTSPGWKPDGQAGAGLSRLSGCARPGGLTHSSWGAAGSCSSWLLEGGAGCTGRTHIFPPSCSGSRSGGRSGRETSDCSHLLAGGRRARSRTPRHAQARPPTAWVTADPAGWCPDCTEIEPDNALRVWANGEGGARLSGAGAGAGPAVCRRVTYGTRRRTSAVPGVPVPSPEPPGLRPWGAQASAIPTRLKAEKLTPGALKAGPSAQTP